VELHDLTLTEARDAIADRRLGSEELTRALLDRAAALEPSLGCFISILADDALERARAIDQRLGKAQYAGPLAGVPLAIKDNICLNRGRTTAASRILERYESPYSATAADRLERAGAIILGKTNLDEFAMGSSTEHSAFHQTKNPWDTSRIPGGTSGGSAAAVAARIVPAALGSDTGGSIRQPAALCGVVGLKPTYGVVSRYGLIAHASSLDQIGPITRTVRDSALILEVIGGRDTLDSTSADRDAPALLAAIDEPIKGLRLGVPKEVRSPQNHPAVSESFENAIHAFRDMGAATVDVELPHLKYGIAAYYLISTAEASSNLARFDGVRYGRRAALSKGDDLLDLYERSRAEGLGREVQRRIMLGTYALSAGYYDAYYLTALKARRKIKEDFDRAFTGGCDALLMPATVGPAFRLGEKTDDPLAMYLEDIYTVTINLAGVPAITLPMGIADEGSKQLPLGLQIVGRSFDEERLLRIARMFEQHSPMSGGPCH
jgi:aspartyl-tRNA(Asn)/glutamyl-tRNA(Gln) amidotransferase subunit A